MFFCKNTRSFLKHIRVESKEELRERINKGTNEINNDQEIFCWKYNLDEIKAIVLE